MILGRGVLVKSKVHRKVRTGPFVCASIELAPEREDTWSSDGWNMNEPSRYTASDAHDESRDIEAFLRDVDEFVNSIGKKYGLSDLYVCTMQTASKKFYTEETDPQEDALTETAL